MVKNKAFHSPMEVCKSIVLVLLWSWPDSLSCAWFESLIELPADFHQSVIALFPFFAQVRISNKYVRQSKITGTVFANFSIVHIETVYEWRKEHQCSTQSRNYSVVFFISSSTSVSSLRYSSWSISAVTFSRPRARSNIDSPPPTTFLPRLPQFPPKVSSGTLSTALSRCFALISHQFLSLVHHPITHARYLFKEVNHIVLHLIKVL